MAKKKYCTQHQYKHHNNKTMEEEIKYLKVRIRFLENVADKQSTQKNVDAYQYEAQLCRNILKKIN